MVCVRLIVPAALSIFATTAVNVAVVAVTVTAVGVCAEAQELPSPIANIAAITALPILIVTSRRIAEGSNVLWIFQLAHVPADRYPARTRSGGTPHRNMHSYHLSTKTCNASVQTTLFHAWRWSWCR